jgi:hypothetical protein
MHPLQRLGHRDVPQGHADVRRLIADLEPWEKFAGIRVRGLSRLGHAWFKQRDVALISADSVQDVQPSGKSGK